MSEPAVCIKHKKVECEKCFDFPAPDQGNRTSELDNYSKVLDILVAAIDNDEIEVGERRSDGRRHKSISNELTKRLARLISQEAAKARIDEVQKIYAAYPFDEENSIVDAKRQSRGEKPLDTLVKYLDDRLDALQGGLNDD